MPSVRVRLIRSAAVLTLLHACAPALAAPALPRAAGGLTVLALLALLAASAAVWSVWRKIRQEDQIGELGRRLEQERQARTLAEQESADSHALLCKLVLEQAAVRDTERSRIARDIHDDLGQTLLALRIDLSLLQVATNAMHPAVHEKAGQMGASLDHAIRALRAVINDLRPLALNEGLRPALERLLDEFTRIYGIAHVLDIDAEALARIAGERDTEGLLYRVAQEGLANVARHAQAGNVRVTLGCDGARLLLCVHDDGVGIEAGLLERGCGLAGMRERARIARAELAIDSKPGAGTVLALTVPLVQEAIAS